MSKSYRTSPMNTAETIAALREAFQLRTGNLCLQPFCLTEAEVEEQMSALPVASLLEAYTRCGNEVRKLRDNEMVYLDEADIMQCLAKHISRQHDENVRAFSRPQRTRRRDYAQPTTAQ